MEWSVRSYPLRSRVVGQSQPFGMTTPRSSAILRKRIRDLFDVVAVIDAIASERVAETPELLDDVDVVHLVHAAMASFSS